MKFGHGLAAGAFIAGLSSGAVAQSEAPNLVGTWVKTVSEAAHWGGTVEDTTASNATLVVEEQFGGVFRGTMAWENDPEGPDFEGREGISLLQKESVVGVIQWDNETVYWADIGDETTYTFQLVDHKTMRGIALEAGDYAVAVRLVLVKQ